MTGKRCKLVLAVAAACCLALIPSTAVGALSGLLPAAAPAGITVKVATSGAASGTKLVTLNIDAAGKATMVGIPEQVSATSTHGSYVSPGGLVYVNKFAGGGIEVYDNSSGSWKLKGTLAAQAGTMNCSLDLMDGKQDPESGMLQMGDMGSGFIHLINMNNGAPAWGGRILGGYGTVCDMMWTENPDTKTAVSSGSSGIYVWDASQAQYLPDDGPLFAPRGYYRTVAHQGRTITAPNGKEYILIAEGSSGQILVLDSALLSGPTASLAIIGRITVGGESHSAGFITDGATTNKATSPYAVIADSALGSLKVAKLFKSDGSPNMDGAGQELPVVTSTIPGIGLAADIGGVDIVQANGVWQRN